MTAATTEKAPRIGGVPDKALLKAAENAIEPVTIEWKLGQGNKKYTHIRFESGIFLSAESNTGLLTELIDLVILLRRENDGLEAK
jgi:hypothetical protein